MTDSLAHRLKAWLDQATFADVLSALRIVAEETRKRGVRQGHSAFFTQEDE